MTVSDIKRKIFAILLIAALTLPVTGYAAETDDAGAEGTPAADELQTEVSGSDNTVVDEAQSEDADAVQNESVSEQADKSAGEPALKVSAEKSKKIQEIILNASWEENSITAVWKPVASADRYIAYLDGVDEESAAQTKTIDIEENGKCRVVFEGVDNSRKNHTVRIEAYITDDTDESQGEDVHNSSASQLGGQKDGDIEPDPEPELIAEGSMGGIAAVKRNRLSNGTRSARNLGINLKTLIGESHDGYSVVQGGCTDGTYAYYLMVSPSTQNGRILKLRISDNVVIGRSAVIKDMEHGNGMTMDTTRNRLIISGRSGWKNRVTAVDAGTLNTIRYHTLDYSMAGKWTETKSYGISSIAYVKKYDCFIGVQRESHDLLVMDKDFKVIGFIGTTVTAKYPGTYQAMDADDRYVYILLSYYNSRQPYNKILVLDWNSENLGINTDWRCSNNVNSSGELSGEPDAAIKLNTPYEAENIYHIERGDGTSDFYLSEYYNNPKTKYVYKKKKVKVKWKKVKKKVKVKWKKVNGKWKYKKKWKKVWKYKKKWKTVKVKSGTYLNREGYVYALGQF